MRRELEELDLCVCRLGLRVRGFPHPGREVSGHLFVLDFDFSSVSQRVHAIVLNKARDGRLCICVDVVALCGHTRGLPTCRAFIFSFLFVNSWIVAFK